MFGGVPQPQTSRNGPKRPETAVFGVFLMPPANGWRRENLLPFYYWLPFNFRFLAQQPPNKVESFLPPDFDPLT